jgi:NAD(P)-dependent dehydrogenase (short-subunit alcohol dehydrogenase family)
MIPLALFYSIVSQHWMKGRISIRALPPPSPPADEDEKEEKIAIITGCNTGIGYETARTLIVRYHYTVIFACRDEQKARAAMATISSGSTNHNKKAVFIAPLDLASFQSVHDFCTAVGKKFGAKKKIQLLINNAGRNTSGISIDDLDLQFQTNFLGHFLLTKLLIEQGLIDDGTSSLKNKFRIVNLASVMHHFCGSSSQMDTIEFWKRTAAIKKNVRMVYGMPVDDPMSKGDHDGNNNTYSVSKLAAILFTNELNRRYPQMVTAVTANPGAVYVVFLSGFLLLLLSWLSRLFLCCCCRF